jgi:hypothetical protein
MNKTNERGPSAYNTPYDEFPDDLSFFPPHMFLWISQIMLTILGGAVLISMVANNFLPKEIYWGGFAGGNLLAIYITACNARIAYGYVKWVTPIQVLCVLYIVAAIPNFFYEHALMALIPIVAAATALWITVSDKGALFLYHRVRLGEWRRDQLEKNKIRREVIRERKAQAKAKRRKN